MRHDIWPEPSSDFDLTDNKENTIKPEAKIYTWLFDTHSVLRVCLWASRISSSFEDEIGVRCFFLTQQDVGALFCSADGDKEGFASQHVCASVWLLEQEFSDHKHVAQQSIKVNHSNTEL